MTTKISFKARSYRKAGSDKWVPSGTIAYSDSVRAVEVEKDFKSSTKVTKKDADEYFLATVRKTERK